MLGVSRSEARRHFGVDSKNSFSLKNRLWARLMEQLSLMRVAKDPNQDNVYRFSNERKTILVKVSSQWFEDCSYQIIELLDGKYRTLLREEIFPDGLGGNFTYHPASELSELIKGVENSELEGIRVLSAIIA